MTLSPVFRSERSADRLAEWGLPGQLSGAIEEQRRALAEIHAMLPAIIDARYVQQCPAPESDVVFLQENFFPVLFTAILAAAGCRPSRLHTYALINCCIRGLITASDNLFDGEHKRCLPLALGSEGPCFSSIMELLCHQRLLRRALDRAVLEGDASHQQTDDAERALLSSLAAIGRLEGQEEAGVDCVLPVDEMLARVHRVRGGALFELAFIAPLHLESGPVRQRCLVATSAARRLGTAFQIVDDVTDLEIDAQRHTHNLLLAAAWHDGSAQERAFAAGLLHGQRPRPGSIEQTLAASAGRVLAIAVSEAERAFSEISGLGLVLPPQRAHDLVSAIAGAAGQARLEELSFA